MVSGVFCRTADISLQDSGCFLRERSPKDGVNRTEHVHKTMLGLLCRQLARLQPTVVNALACCDYLDMPVEQRQNFVPDGAGLHVHTCRRYVSMYHRF